MDSTGQKGPDGQTLVQVATMLTVLLASVAIAVDAGHAFIQGGRPTAGPR